MDLQLIIRKLIAIELKRCKKLYGKLVRYSEDLPEGSLVSRNGKLYRYLRKNKKQYSVMVNEQNDIVMELRHRRLIKLLLSGLGKHIKACEEYLKNDEIYDPEEIERNLPQTYKGALDKRFFADDDPCFKTIKRKGYKTNTMKFREEHYTSGGVRCRSKSEALIGTRLEERGIKYRYEAGVRLDNGEWIYPDFELELEGIRRFVYLEHFGMVDNPKYAVDKFYRMERYEKNGLYLGVNFFYTFETDNRPLNMKDIDRKIDEILEMERQLLKYKM